MAAKAVELRLAVEGLGCLGKAADDEPIFVLRAQDRIAPGAVRNWAMAAKRQGAPEAKVNEALRLADSMDAWQRKHHERVKVPD